MPRRGRLATLSRRVEFQLLLFWRRRSERLSGLELVRGHVELTEIRFAQAVHGSAHGRGRVILDAQYRVLSLWLRGGFVGIGRRSRRCLDSALNLRELDGSDLLPVPVEDCYLLGRLFHPECPRVSHWILHYFVAL